MKTFTLHIDALISISLLFMLLVGFSTYQHFQYSDLLKSHIDLQLKYVKLDYRNAFMENELKNCKNNLVPDNFTH